MPATRSTELVCPTSSLCIAADDNGNVLTSTSPPFSASTWSTSAVDPFRVITGLACSLNVFCVIGDDAGNVLAGTPTVPVNTAAPTVSGTAIAQQPVTGVHGSWTSNPTSYSDQWEDCDTAGNSCTAIAGAAGLSYTLKPSDAGHTIRLFETASNAAGAGQPATSAPTAVVTTAVVTAAPKPSCTIRAKSANVLLPPAKRATHRGKPKRKPGTLSFVVHCDQAAHVTLQGKLTEVVKPKHGKPKHGKPTETQQDVPAAEDPRLSTTAHCSDAHVQPSQERADSTEGPRTRVSHGHPNRHRRQRHQHHDRHHSQSQTRPYLATSPPGIRTARRLIDFVSAAEANVRTSLGHGRASWIRVSSFRARGSERSSCARPGAYRPSSPPSAPHGPFHRR